MTITSLIISQGRVRATTNLANLLFCGRGNTCHPRDRQGHPREPPKDLLGTTKDPQGRARDPQRPLGDPRDASRDAQRIPSYPLGRSRGALETIVYDESCLYWKTYKNH